MKWLIILIVVAAAIAGSLIICNTSICCGDCTVENMKDIERVTREVENGEAVLIDVRRSEELDEDGYAPGSIHFPIEQIREGELPDIDKNLKVYTYCKSGGRAGEAKTILEDNGFKKVINIGGLSDWEAAGGAVIRD